MDEEDDRKPAALGGPKDESAPNTPSKKVKPALKKMPNAVQRDKHLKWDEPTIEEHDQLRGTRMKIDEPNTPFAQYDSGAESDDSRRPKSPANQKPALSWDNLQTRLDSVAAVREQYPSSPSEHAEADHSDVEDDRKKEMRNLEFKEHRKRHYNEMEIVRKFREEHPDCLEANGDADVEDGNISN
jgi:protein phosphatase inhibitor 2